jgi:hypothetical protein
MMAAVDLDELEMRLLAIRRARWLTGTGAAVLRPSPLAGGPAQAGGAMEPLEKARLENQAAEAEGRKPQ